MTWPMPFHSGARSPLYRRQISSPCIRRMSEKDTWYFFTIGFFVFKEKKTPLCSRHNQKWYLNQSWAEWNKQSASYSNPGPIWQLYCPGSEKMNITTILLFISRKKNNNKSMVKKTMENIFNHFTQQNPTFKKQCSIPGILSASCRSQPPVWPEDQRYSGTGRRLRSAAAHVGVPHPHRAFLDLLVSLWDCPVSKNRTIIKSSFKGRERNAPCWTTFIDAPRF